MIRAAAGVALVFALPAMADELRICTEVDYPPFMALDGHGELYGFDRDLGDAICGEMGADCTWEVREFNEILETVAAGGCDMGVASIAATPTRRKIVDFSDPYGAGGPSAGVFAGLDPNQRIEDARIGVQAGTVHAEHLAGTGREALTFASNSEALDALAKRRIDLVFTSDGVIRRAQEGQYPGLRLLQVEEIEGWGTAVAVAHGAVALRDRISSAIHALREDGTIGGLEARWFAPGTTT